MTEPIDQATIQAIDALTKQIAELMEKLKQERNKVIDDAINCVAHGVSKGVPADKIVELLVRRFKDKSHE